MARGRKPIPTKIKKLRGNLGRRRRTHTEPKPPTQMPTCPNELSAVAKREWNRVVPVLQGCGLLSQLDRAALAAYCQSWARWLDAEKRIRHDGMVITTVAGGTRKHPAVTVANEALTQLRAFAAELGLTPAARTRISISARLESQDKLEKFIGSRIA